MNYTIFTMSDSQRKRARTEKSADSQTGNPSVSLSAPPYVVDHATIGLDVSSAPGPALQPSCSISDIELDDCNRNLSGIPLSEAGFDLRVPCEDDILQPHESSALSPAVLDPALSQSAASAPAVLLPAVAQQEQLDVAVLQEANVEPAVLEPSMLETAGPEQVPFKVPLPPDFWTESFSSHDASLDSSDAGSVPEAVPPDEALNRLLSQLLDDDDQELEVDEEVEHGVPYESPDDSDRNSPLYTGATITLHQSFVCLLTIMLAFKLTGVCVKAILNLIAMHLPKMNHFKSSFYYFKKYFSHIQSAKSYIYFCSICMEKCERDGCADHVTAKVCYMVKIPLASQLQTMFNREGFFSKLQFAKKGAKGFHFSDMFDGSVYQNLVNGGFLDGGPNISFSWYTDGMALYKSSNMSVWPLYLVINELPYHARFKKENILLPLLWCGPVKPNANQLVLELYPELKELFDGVKFNIGGQEKKIRAVVTSGLGDTPARSLMMNMVQFNGAHSCQKCEQPGKPRADNPGVRIFPYAPEEMKPRTSESYLECAARGTPKLAYKGIKGPSGLESIMSDVVQGVSIDPMHQIFGGVAKKIVHLLTQSKQSKKFSISEYAEVINQKLLSIKLPAHYLRLPRTLSELAYWKMKELKDFFLDYSLPIFDDVLPTGYLRHHGTLVAAVQLLSSDVVSEESLQSAEKLIHVYYAQFADFYGEQYLTINFHLLLHLVEMVRALGPLWVYSCFPLEGLNGEILRLVHGTRWAEKQIGDSVQVCMNLPEIVKSMEDCKAKKFCEGIFHRHECSISAEVKGSKIIGPSSLLDSVPEALQDVADSSLQKVKEFSCLKRGKYIYVTEDKVQAHGRRDSSVASFVLDNLACVGVLQNLYRVYQCKCQTECECDSDVYCLISLLEVKDKFLTLIDNITVPNVASYKRTSSYHVVSADKLKGVCVKMQLGNVLYISKPSNSKETE